MRRKIVHFSESKLIKMFSCSCNIPTESKGISNFIMWAPQQKMKMTALEYGNGTGIYWHPLDL